MFKNEQTIQRDVISAPQNATHQEILPMDGLFHSTSSPRNTSGLNEGNSAWHLCESEENQILLLTDGQRVDLSPRDVNQGSLIAPLIRSPSLRAFSRHCAGLHRKILSGDEKGWGSPCSFSSKPHPHKWNSAGH